MSVPVLLLAFNRPSLTAQVLDRLTSWSVPRLYIHVDGPRPHVDTDVERCRAVRQLIESTPTTYPIEVWFRDRNAGCAVGVSEAISWFFDNESAGIILEDDCIPRPTFLPFCAELLDRYRDIDHVMTISGNNFTYDHSSDPRSYSFIRQPQIWGWASWRRAWQHFDFAMSTWPRLRSTTWLAEVCSGHRDAIEYWRAIFDRTHRQEIDSWAYRWTFASWVHSGLSITPGINLVDNVGFGPEATHTDSRPVWLDRVHTSDIEFPLRHPAEIAADSEAERWIDINIFDTRPSLRRRFKHRIATAVRRR